MQGVIRLARLAGIEISDEVLSSYGKNFFNAIKAIKRHSDEKIFEDYITFFKELKEEYRGKSESQKINCESCDAIITNLEEIYKQHIKARDNLIEMLKSYIELESNIVDLIHHIEIVIAAAQNKTSLSSPDQHVLLHHIRIIGNSPANHWKIEKIPQGYYLTSEYTDAISAQDAYSALMKICEIDPDCLSLRIDKNVLHIIINNIKLDRIYATFSEDRIKKIYHSNEFSLYNHYQQEAELINLTQTLSTNGLKCELKCIEESENEYQLIFQSNTDDLAFQLIKNSDLLQTGKIVQENGNYLINFHYKLLPTVLSETKRISSILNEMKKFDEIRQSLAIKLTLTYENNRFIISHEMDSKDIFISILNDFYPSFTVSENELENFNKQLFIIKELAYKPKVPSSYFFDRKQLSNKSEDANPDSTPSIKQNYD